MKIVFKNSNIVFAKGVTQVSYSSIDSKYLDDDGIVQDATYSTNKVTEELPADNYIVSGCFSANTGRISVAWYDSGHNFISGVRLNEGDNTTAKVERAKLTKPENASYVKFAYVYSGSGYYALDLSIYKE